VARIFVLSADSIGCWLPAEKPAWRATEQRAVNLLAHLVECGLAQPEEFAVQNGKGVKEREGDDFDPEQRHHGYGMVMGAMGQMPVLGQFTKGVVLDLPTQVSDIPDSGAVVPLPIPRLWVAKTPQAVENVDF
jgi:hypothetical protein